MASGIIVPEVFLFPVDKFPYSKFNLNFINKADCKKQPALPLNKFI